MRDRRTDRERGRQREWDGRTDGERGKAVRVAEVGRGIPVKEFERSMVEGDWTTTLTARNSSGWMDGGTN